MTNPTLQLTETDVAKIETRLTRITGIEMANGRHPASWDEVSALVRDWRAMRAESQRLRTSFEISEASRTSDAECHRDLTRTREAENAALREQLAQAESLASIRSDIIAAKAAHVDELQSQLAQVTGERDAFKRGEFICQRCHLRKDAEFEGGEFF